MKKIALRLFKIVGISLVLLFTGCSLKTGYEIEKNSNLYIGE